MYLDPRLELGRACKHSGSTVRVGVSIWLHRVLHTVFRSDPRIESRLELEGCVDTGVESKGKILRHACRSVHNGEILPRYFGGYPPQY